jgi:hypothetical protein
VSKSGSQTSRTAFEEGRRFSIEFHGIRVSSRATTTAYSDDAHAA